MVDAEDARVVLQVDFVAGLHCTEAADCDVCLIAQTQPNHVKHHRNFQLQNDSLRQLFHLLFVDPSIIRIVKCQNANISRNSESLDKKRINVLGKLFASQSTLSSKGD